MDIKTGRIHLKEYDYKNGKTLYKELLDGVASNLYAEDWHSVVYTDLATNTEISRAEFFIKYYPAFLPLQETIHFMLNNDVALSEEQQKIKLTEFFLDSYTPNLPQDTPEWIVKTIRYLRTRTNFAYIDGATLADFSLSSTIAAHFLLYSPMNT